MGVMAYSLTHLLIHSLTHLLSYLLTWLQAKGPLPILQPQGVSYSKKKKNPHWYGIYATETMCLVPVTPLVRMKERG